MSNPIPLNDLSEIAQKRPYSKRKHNLYEITLNDEPRFVLPVDTQRFMYLRAVQEGNQRFIVFIAFRNVARKLKNMRKKNGVQSLAGNHAILYQK